MGRTGQARKKTSEHPQHSRAIANSIAGRVGEHPNEKDQRTGELQRRIRVVINAREGHTRY